jgi:hypothetical protein
MKTFVKMMGCFVLAAFSASALEKELVDNILSSARNIERDASAVNAVLKNRNFDASEVKNKIGAMEADLNRLRQLVSDFEASNATLSSSDKEAWHKVKMKVQLLEIFHSQKKKLADEDLDKNRSLIRSHAGGVAKRAQLLQQTATKLQRSPLS